MPWNEDKPLDQRVQLIQEYNDGESIVALAEIYGVARKTIYKWIDRHEIEGSVGLSDRSRAPLNSPTRVGDDIVKLIIAARQRWHWGPRKLRVKLAAAHPEIIWPVESTIGGVLKRAGLTHQSKRRPRTPPYAKPFGSVDAANQTWCADFKGWFRTADGTRCDPLTITDAHSRYLIRCQITSKADTTHVAAVFTAAFREFGLPSVIRTDNGTPFASCAPGGLSRLSVSWIKLGILPERTRPASPQDNGRHERMHLTLKQSTLTPPERNRRRQQLAFDLFRKEFNHERPHESLDNATPASWYVPSPRSMPHRLPSLEYGENIEVRTISQKGAIKWKAERTFISEIFAYEQLGLRALDERYMEVLCGPLRIGFLDTCKHEFLRTLSVALKNKLGLTNP
jgi:putative transposase